MNKKFFRNAIVISTLFLLSGCNNTIICQDADLETSITVSSSTAEMVNPECEEIPSLDGIITYPRASVIAESPKTFGDISISRTRYTLRSPNFASNQIVIDLDLHYPQVSCSQNSMTEQKINLMFFDIAFKACGDKLSLLNAEKTFRELQTTTEHTDTQNLCGEIDYKIMACDANYLSIWFFGTYTWARTRVYSYEYLVTINTATADYECLYDCFDVNQISTDILRGNFELISGDYLPGGINLESIDVRQQFVDVLISELQGFNHGEWVTGRCLSGKNLQVIDTSNGKYEFEEYDIYKTGNFVVDGNDLFIHLPYSDSLHGYVILQLEVGR